MFSCEFCEISKDTFFTEHLKVKNCISLHGDKNVSIVKKITWELKETLLFQTICASTKANVRHQQKSSLKNIYVYSRVQSIISNALKTLNTRGGVILTLSFPDNMMDCFCNCFPFPFPLSKECFVLNKN